MSFQICLLLFRKELYQKVSVERNHKHYLNLSFFIIQVKRAHRVNMGQKWGLGPVSLKLSFSFNSVTLLLQLQESLRAKKRIIYFMDRENRKLINDLFVLVLRSQSSYSHFYFNNNHLRHAF